MSLKGDQNGIVTIPQAVATGDFSVLFDAAEFSETGSGNAEILIGSNLDTHNFIAFFDNGLAQDGGVCDVAGRVNNNTTTKSSDVSGNQSKLEFKRVSSTIEMLINDAVTATDSFTGDFVLDTFFAYNSGQLKYDGLISGIVTMTGFSGGTRTYDTNGSGTTLVDTTSGQNGTLSGFTTGGFTDITQDIIVDDYKFSKDTGGTVNVSITGELFVATTNIEYRVDGGSWQVGAASPTIGAYSFNIPLTKGQYVVDVRLADDITKTATASYITVCDVITVAGQSNASGRGTSSQVYSHGTGGERHCLLGNDLVYKELVDPYDSNANQVYSDLDDSSAAGSFTLRFAHHYMLNNNTPLAFVPANKGGTAIASWAKGGTLYTAMTNMINDAGGTTTVLWHQGETDASLGTLLATYEAALNQFVDDVFADFGCDVIIVALQTIDSIYNGNGTTTGQAAIRQAQVNVAASNAHASITVPNSDIDVSVTGDGLHFKTDNDLDLVGSRVYDSYTYESSTLNITNTNTPDGVYSADIYNSVSKLLIETKDITFSGGSAAYVSGVSAATELWVLVEGSNPPTTGLAYIGVTE